MKILSLPVVALSTALALASCSSDPDNGGDQVAVDARGPDENVPSAAPVPTGPVRTVNLVTVMDTGTPELCLGAVAESYPPQCGGPEIINGSWDDLGSKMFEQQGDIRWGTYVLTGTWDGTAFTATDAIPGALYDPAAPQPSTTPTPATAYSDAELEAIGTRLTDELPGVQGAYGGSGSDGHVLVDVVYDDGTLQRWADQEYGADVVLVSAALVDAS